MSQNQREWHVQNADEGCSCCPFERREYRPSEATAAAGPYRRFIEQFHFCIAAEVMDLREESTEVFTDGNPAPEWCPLRAGAILVRGDSQ